MLFLRHSRRGENAHQKGGTPEVTGSTSKRPLIASASVPRFVSALSAASLVQAIGPALSMTS